VSQKQFKFYHYSTCVFTEQWHCVASFDLNAPTSCVVGTLALLASSHALAGAGNAKAFLPLPLRLHRLHKGGSFACILFNM